MPERYHFSQNQRIAPLWIVPSVGWAITPKHEFDLQEAPARGEVYHPRGLHGYDHEHPLMRAIFIAKGPAFPHPEGSMIDAFQNTEVYNIVCDSLGLEPRKNNGTIRLPFTVSGLHDPDGDVIMSDDVDDFELVPALLPPEIPKPVGPPSLNPTPTEESGDSPVPVASNAPVDSSDPEVNGDAIEPTQDKPNSWTVWVNSKLHAIKDWATDVFGSHKTKSPP